MRILVAGSSGLIGTASVAWLRAHGHEVRRLVRRPPGAPDEWSWDPRTGRVDPAALDRVDAVVNLCGSSVGARRWSGAVKQELRDSRIVPTDVLAAAVAAAGVPTLVNAGAVGFYGDTGETVVDERSPAGQGFVADLCRDWEAATAPAREAGVRTIVLRTGIVLAPHGGILRRLEPLFRLGLGSRLGDGRQYMSWVALEDAVAAVGFVLGRGDIAGPVDVTGPAPVTNARFTEALAHSVHRLAPWTTPGFVVAAVAGEMARALVLTGQRALPAVLESTGFEFRYPTIGAALGNALAS
ncbi:TIGR01777 family oxidoreductase [Rhodococcus aetherivorans]|uniref:TIGR01777 family oxidoreductase n=1 Tax=Rhodococcus aetherivorans TaxID=191292 RepID=A0AA46NYD9_9NOCA|nr:TIGR01777 family oxidoreductase [Rhodococcus aetherivorans]UGQ43447.1 TIGR01777 family oxidoreductase [Rhodococcus aetherivorans]UYF96653.1 TIGR01777 family oxidoreductase [Rhodococcus aetherivorans]